MTTSASIGQSIDQAIPASLDSVTVESPVTPTIKVLRFAGNTETGSFGRNGWMKTVGLEVSTLGQVISVSPVNSKDRVGRCSIQIPNDRQHVEALIEVLRASLDYETDPSSEKRSD